MLVTENSILVSVVIPTYNRLPFLKETVHSILNQSYTKFELIIVADYSATYKNDFSDSIFQDKRISIIELHEKTTGPAAVRNIGIKAAKGEWIAFCDDDDLWHTEKLSIQLDVINDANTDLQIIASNSTFTGAKGDIRLRSGAIKNLINCLSIIPVKYRICLYNCIIICSAVVHRSVFDRFGLFDEAPELIGHEDTEFWLRIVNHCRVKVITKNLIIVRFHKNHESLSRIHNYKATSFSVLKKKAASFSWLQRLLVMSRICIFRITGF